MVDEPPLSNTSQVKKKMSMKDIREINMKTRTYSRDPETRNQKACSKTGLKCIFCSLGILACAAFVSVIYVLICRFVI